MNKKILTFSLITILTFIFASFTFATDVVMDLNSTVGIRNETTNDSNTSDASNSVTGTNNTSDESTIDNTIYSSNTDATADTSVDVQEPTVTSATEYEDSGDLSITNMINIILIVVGIVLILLGIAIIIRLK